MSLKESDHRTRWSISETWLAWETTWRSLSLISVNYASLSARSWRLFREGWLTSQSMLIDINNEASSQDSGEQSPTSSKRLRDSTKILKPWRESKKPLVNASSRLLMFIGSSSGGLTILDQSVNFEGSSMKRLKVKAWSSTSSTSMPRWSAWLTGRSGGSCPTTEKRRTRGWTSLGLWSDN